MKVLGSCIIQLTGWRDSLGWIKIFLMTFLPLCSFLLLFGHSCDTLPLSFGVGVLLQSPFQVHREKVFVLLPCTSTGRLWWPHLRRSCLAAAGFLSFLLMDLVQLFLSTLGCFCLLSLCWHMLGSRVNLLYLSGLKRREGGSGILVTIPRVGRREWRWQTSPFLWRKV